MTSDLLLLLVPLIVVAGLVLLGTRLPNGHLGPLLALPAHRLAPVVAGIVTGAAVWYAWGGLHAPAPIHDEASYLLQARNFASFHWAMPAPPLPSFFEQYHTFVTPTIASKYPPGHALLLVPGIWLSLPGLIPVLLSALAGGLLFALVRRVTNPWVAVLTFVLWVPTTANLRFRATYMSETTSSVLWLLGWWALLEWRARRSNRWLVVLAACVAWMAITRPFTAVAYAIPVGAVVIMDLTRRRQWRELVRPALVGLGILALLPIWNQRTLGDWRTAPYQEYSRIYFPFDDVGFGLNAARPQRPLPPDMQQFTQLMGQPHAFHTPDRLPAIFLDRWHALFADALGGWRASLALFAIIGLAVLGAPGWFAVASAVLLTAVYLAFAHPTTWMVYYLEIFPLVPFLTALGIGTVASALVSPNARIGRRLARDWGPRQALGAFLVTVALLWPTTYGVLRARNLQAAVQSYHLWFERRIATIPDQRAIVFIRYGPRHNVHHSLIANDPDLAHARLWIVYDRGPANRQLAALAPDRATYLFDEASGSLMRLTRTAGTR